MGSYLNLPIIAIGGLGVAIALIITGRTNREAGEEQVPMAEEASPQSPVFSRADIRSLFFRSLTLEANFNFETCQNTCFAFSMIPILRKIYSTKEAISPAIKRHLPFFNTSPFGSALILGIAEAVWI